MADYYTPTVVEPMIPLTAILPIERLFLAKVFSEEIEGETAYYCSDDGASDLITLGAEAVRTALETTTAETSSLTKKLLDELGDAIQGDEEIELNECGDLWADVLQDIVRRSPDLDHLTVFAASACAASHTASP